MRRRADRQDFIRPARSAKKKVGGGSLNRPRCARNSSRWAIEVNRPYLFRCGQRLIEARFASNGGVTMNDAPFGSFIDRRNNGANLIWLRVGLRCFVKSTESSQHTTIAQRVTRSLTRSFGGGPCVSHSGILAKIRRHVPKLGPATVLCSSRQVWPEDVPVYSNRS